jgi:hypothetical protein
MSFALPDYKNLPSLFSEGFLHHEITSDIPSELLSPKFDAAFGRRCLSASLVTMPEATMHEHDFLAPQKNKIGASW